jgi:hypothetical protein
MRAASHAVSARERRVSAKVTHERIKRGDVKKLEEDLSSTENDAFRKRTAKL